MRQKIEISFQSNKMNRMTLKYFKNENGDFVCPECHVVKKRQNSMHYHMKKHLEELDHVCKVCKKGFLQKQTLDLHVRSKHPELAKEEAKRFVCPFDECEFTALTKGNCVIHCLRVHYQEEMKEIMQIDEETKIIVCTKCDTEFQSSCSFYYHCKKCMDVLTDDTFEAIRELV
jgi:hypothetical protein